MLIDACSTGERGGRQPWSKAAPRVIHQLAVLALLTIGTEAEACAAEMLADRAAPRIPRVKCLVAPGLHNFFVLEANVFSGSSPHGEEGFAALERLGVKTIITVDGARPDVEAARRHGIRYVHLPHGYDGIGTTVQLQLAKAGQALPGPIYVHCHHGLHRGPAAAAIICMTNNGWTAAQAEAWLLAAGTSTNYAGLYDVARKFRPPTPEQLRAVPAEFPEAATVSGLIDAMVQIDERWEHLKAIRAAGYRAPREHPDIQPANEAVILREHYREAQQLADAARHGTKFLGRLKAAEVEAAEAERQLRLFAAGATPGVRRELERTFDGMSKTCASCHKAHRDPGGDQGPAVKSIDGIARRRADPARHSS